ncbi:MAG TPA: magnesium transporter CorA family protein [Steroidobacteraceae bacterium]|nr:magnesium transporter CorA family protein [Steroidobacteraceae bacterium]
MLSVYCLTPTGLRPLERNTNAPLPEEAVWLDLLEPTLEEEKLVEQRLGLDIPTREEMRDIESSSRLYEEGGALYLTATVVTKLDTQLPENAQITFILRGARLVTNRYVDPLPLRRFVAHTERHPLANTTAQAVLAGLLESIVERIADVIERVSSDMDGASVEVFSHRMPAGGKARRSQRDFRKVLEVVGQSGELIAKARESLASLSRLLAFVQQSQLAIPQDVRTRLRTLSHDVVAMSDHASFLATNLNFILDATLGMINIDQNNILKIFSVVTVFMLPPSVIGAIFGMNFTHIPTSAQPWGFWGAIGLMVVSSVVPYLWFRQKGWL